MTRVAFICDGAPLPREWRGSGWEATQRLDTRGSRKSVNFHVDDLEARSLGRLDGRALDLVRIASYAYAADQSVRRGGDADVSLRGWRRTLALAVPVNDLDFWSSDDIRTALTSCLGFLSDDEWRFSFVGATHADERRLVLAEADPAATRNTDTVLAFSGGMDSLGAAVEELHAGRKPLLVSHLSTSVPERRRRELVAALRQRFGAGSISRLGAEIHRIGDDAVEPTRRVRSFLFASIAAVAAHRIGVGEVLLADNGIVSLNLPISDQLVGALATRSTHPRFILLLNELLALVFDSPVTVRNPLWDSTRVDVLNSLRERRAEPLIALTLSCAAWRNRPRYAPHCDVCSQCVDRRFATTHAGLQEHDVPERYGLDIFREQLTDGPARQTVLTYVRFARRVESLADDALFDAFPQLWDALLPGREARDADAYVGMLRRHSSSVLGVLAQEFQRNATLISRGLVSGQSLLALAATSARVTDSLLGDDSFKYSGDYRTVVWRGEPLLFTRPQGIVVGNLHHAHLERLGGLSSVEALKGTEVQSIRLSEVFRNSPAWNRLIVRGERRGTYRLAIP